MISFRQNKIHFSLFRELQLITGLLWIRDSYMN